MKMHLKRIVSAVCALALCASVVSTPVLADDNTGVDPSLSATQTMDVVPEETPQVTENPEETPVVTENPEETPEVTENPEETPEVTENPEETPEVTENPEETPEVTENPEETPEVTENPEETPEVTEQPTENPDVNVRLAPSNDVAKYSTGEPEKVSVEVNDEKKLGVDEGIDHTWTVGPINDSDNPYIKLTENRDGTATITGLKATAGTTVTVTHTYKIYHFLWTEPCEEVFSVTVLPEMPAEIYFFVSIPTNEAMSSKASDYRFLMVGGEVKNPESLVQYQESNPIKSYDDETLLTGCVNKWPEAGEDGKIYLNSENGYGSDPVAANSWIQLEDGKIVDFNISFSYVDENGDDQTANYTPTDDEGNKYALRWTKFSYAGTTGENWQFHMDAMLYQSVTVEQALQEINARKHVDGSELDANGNATNSTFSFTLNSADEGRTFTALDLNATVESDSKDGYGSIVAANDETAETELVPGNYVITENAPTNSNVWNTTSDKIEFTVASDGSVTVKPEAEEGKPATEAVINNTLKKYTVTYDSGVEGDAYVSKMPEQREQAYAYNELTDVAAAPQRTGYQFTGWLGDDGKPYEAGAEMSITKSITLTAQWSVLDVGVAGTTGKVEVGKTATDLVGNQTNVTLSVGADQKKVGSDVVFVLDKSTSTDVKNEALAMLDELMDKAETNGLNVKVGVVTFNRTADNNEFNLDLTPLNQTSYDQIETIFGKTLETGTNIEAGIRAGMAMLESDDTVYDTNKHLVLVTDGVAYMWGTGSEPQTVYVHLGNTWAASVDLVNKDYQYRDKNFDSYKNAAQWMADAKAGGIEDIISKYQTTYTANSGTNFDKVAPDETRYSSLECAVYMAGKAWQEAADAGYHLYAFASNDYTVQYPWGPNFVSGLNTIGGMSTLYSDTNTGVDGMFSAVEDTILYTIQEGTVTDVIGTDFDLNDLANITLTVGDGDPMTGTQVGNTVHFGAPDENGTYPYDVTYYQNGTDADSREQLEWKINTPVKSNAGLQLTYTLNLVNQSSEVGDNTVETNEVATLEYTSTTGDDGSEEFPVPEVTYHVAKLEPAEMTIYMGGDKGYTGVVDEDGTIVSNNSLPQPGFYITLPEAVNEALQNAKIGTSNDPVNLSDYIKIYTTDQTDSREWTLASYGASYSAAYGKYIYAVVPANDTKDNFRLNFTDAAGNTYSSDTFDPAKNGNLSQTYTMSVYPELVKQHQVIIEVKISENETYRCTMVTGTADLNVRYVTDGEVTTSVSTDIAQTSTNEDPDQTALHNAYVVKDPDTKFFINGSQIDVNENGFANVSLLFDDIVSDENTEAASDYETALKDTALEKIGTTLQNVQYQAKYLDLVDANNGNVWLTPSKDVTVYWPYPEGTNANTKFYLVHFKGLNREISLDNVFSSIDSAETEVMELSTDGYGISFKTDSFSPYVLLWDNAKEQPAPSTDNGDDDDNTTSNNNTTTTVNVTTNNNATAPAQPQAVAAIPQTGDSMPVGLLGGVAAAAAIAFAALVMIRKRKKD